MTNKDLNLKTKNSVALIYNPRAGSKRRIIPSTTAPVTLEDIKLLLSQYEISADFLATEHAGHATQLAREAVKKGYKLVLAAGGDGTVGEVINGLVGSDVVLGILPLGSFMNVARMLSIPNDMEKAIQLIKINRTRKIDVGQVLMINNKVLKNPQYFVESAGLGLEAEIFGYVQEFEQGNYRIVWQIIQTYAKFLHQKAGLTIDQLPKFETRASLITISNGPYMGAAVPVAPNAKLNDHRLTISVFKMSKYELLKHFLWLVIKGKIRRNRKVQVYQAKSVKIETDKEKLVHTDGRFFGHTPVEFAIVPNALSIITGFPKKTESSALLRKTYLS